MAYWKNYVWMAAGISALAIVCTFTAKPLLAQIRAALVQNVDEPGRTPYMSSAATFGCTACTLQFKPVPAGKRLVTNNITGLIALETPGVVSFACLESRTNPQLTYCVPTVLQTGVFGVANHVGINAAIAAFFDGPDTPQLELSLTTNTINASLPIVLSGYLVDCSSSGSCAAILQ
jgi:hypothetical protein